MRRSAPRPLSLALDGLTSRLAPPTPLAAVQAAWPQAVGDAIAREATPVAERGGVVTVACDSAVWAHELDLMGPTILERLGEVAQGVSVTALRCVSTGSGIRR